MDPQSISELPQLKLGPGWVSLLVTGEPIAKLTSRGYAPVLPVKVEQTSLDYILYITAKSLSEPLEKLRTQNNWNFTGLKFEIRKQGTEQTSPYEIRQAT